MQPAQTCTGGELIKRRCCAKAITNSINIPASATGVAGSLYGRFRA